MDGALYFTISEYIVWAVGIIFVPILLFRLLRTLPYYVKNGKMGNDDNDLMGVGRDKTKSKLHHLLNETHPSCIALDAAVITGIGIALFMAWIAVPIIAAGWLVIYGIMKYAQHLRNRHLKKEEFVENLKG